MAVERIDPQQAYVELESNPDALLVCAYEEPEKFEQNHLEGAISLDEFKSMVNQIPEDREIIFYCA